MSSGACRLFSDKKNHFLSKSAEYFIVAKDAVVARQQLPWMQLCGVATVGALLPTLLCVLCWLDARALRADVTRMRTVVMTSRCGGYATSSVEGDGGLLSNADIVNGRSESEQQQATWHAEPSKVEENQMVQETSPYISRPGHVQRSQHLAAQARSKRKADRGAGDGRNGRRTSVRPSTARKLRDQKPTFAAIHLSLYIDELSSSDQDSIMHHNATVNIDFGKISNMGYIPTQDNDLEGQPFVYRSWKVADWFNQTQYNQSTLLVYDPQHGTVTVQETGLYYIYSQIRFHHTRYCGYAVMVNDEPRIECLNGRDPIESSPAHWQYTTCHVAAVTWLLAGDRVWLRDAHGSMSEIFEHFVDVTSPQFHAASFWGLVRIA